MAGNTVDLPQHIQAPAPGTAMLGANTRVKGQPGFLGTQADALMFSDGATGSWIAPNVRTRVLGVFMPEGESAADTLDLSRLAAEAAGVETVLEDVTGLLEAAGCYERRDAAIRTVMPEYGPGWKAKIVLPSLLGGSRYSLFTVVAESASRSRIAAVVSPGLTNVGRARTATNIVCGTSNPGARLKP